MASDTQFGGKGIVVAGAAAGPAGAVAHALVERGAEVLLCVPDARDLSGENERVARFAGDISVETEVDRLCEAALERLATLDAVVIIVPAEVVRPLAELSFQEWNAVVVNPLRGPFLLSRRVVEEFLASQTPGRIVLVAGWPSCGSIAVSNQVVIHAALYSLARTVAKEYGRRGITCNVVVLSSPNPASEASALEGEPVCLSRSDVAVMDAICLLASDEASFVNGEALVLTASGGMARASARVDADPPARSDRAR